MQNTKMRLEIAASKKDAAFNRAQIKKVVSAAAALGIDTIKIIGNDPLENNEIVKIVKDIKSVDGIKEISLATNGRLLGNKAKSLADAGLSRATINLDTVHQHRYYGGDIDDVTAGINAATDANLKPVKLNVLLQKDFNDDEVLDFLQLTFQHEYEIRFIEMSEEEEAASKYGFLSCEDVKKRLPALRPGVAGPDGKALEDPRCGVADVYKYPGARGKVGLIAKRADDFLSRCAAVTVRADGTATCPCGSKNVDLKAVINDEEALKEALASAAV